MHEVRTLCFKPDEVQHAIAHRALDKGLFFRSSSQLRCVFSLTPDKRPGLDVWVVTDGGRQSSPVRLHESEAVTALVEFCISRKIPMPKLAEKHLRLIDDQIAVVMDLRLGQLL